MPEESEPPGSASSSKDERCGRCPHARKDHKAVCCVQCTLNDMGTEAQHECHTFVPAAGETAGCVVAHHVHTGGPGDVRLDTCRDDAEEETAGDFVQCQVKYSHGPGVPVVQCTRVNGHPGMHLWAKAEAAGEPEAPECSHPRPREITRGDAFSSFICDECDETWDMRKGPAPRLPYAVAYVTGSGARIELALPGEASCAVADGNLVIRHPGRVLGIAEVKPWEEGA